MQENIVVDFPLRGEWKFLKPPGHHPYAFDFMKVSKDQKSYSNRNFLSYIFGRTPAENFYSWSKPILAPIDGVVIQASDGWVDNKNVNLANTLIIWFKATFLFRPKTDGSKIDIRPNVGNYVMIQSESGVVAFMAHMRRGSVKVAAGQRVIIGQIVGEVGNSGNTTAPHLHLNLFDQVNDLLQAKVLPIAFRHYERWHNGSWETVQNSVPKKGEIIRVQAMSV
ncbi:MAG: M23 family metallopeptidase [Patescibacteria group bacterium]